MRKISLHGLSAVLVAGLLTTACGGDDAGTADTAAPGERVTTETQPAPTPQAPAAGTAAGASGEGQQIFAGAGLCYTCHGPAGGGSALGPNLTDDQWLWIDPAAGDVQTQLVTIIRTGVSQPKEHPAPMPANGGGNLNDQQLEAVASYVASISGLATE